MASEINPIEESTLHLTLLFSEIEVYMKSYCSDKNGEVAKASLQSTILIKACSFIEEFATFKSLTKAVAGIDDFRTRVKPIQKQIDSWVDLKEFRNVVLSHNYRNTKKSGINFFLQGERVYNIPSSPPSMKLLTSCFYLSFSHENSTPFLTNRTL